MVLGVVAIAAWVGYVFAPSSHAMKLTCAVCGLVASCLMLVNLGRSTSFRKP
jgi:hypothetical protein